MTAQDVLYEILTVTTDTYINSQCVVDLFTPLAARFTDLPITVVLDNARYQRNHFVMAEAERIGITLLWLPTYSPNLNLIEWLWKFVKAECLHGRYYATFAPFQQAIIDCLQDPEGRHKAKLATLLTLHRRMRVSARRVLGVYFFRRRLIDALLSACARPTPSCKE